jgi:hypothetical protein
MTPPRVRIFDLVLLIAAVGIGVFLWRDAFIFWEYQAFAGYLGLLSTAALGLWPRNVPTRPFFVGYLSLVTLYFVFVLRLGFANNTYPLYGIGMGYGFMAGVAARWVMPGGPLGLRPTREPSSSE